MPPYQFRRNRAWHVDVNAEQFGRRLHTHLFGDDRTPIAALRHKLRVSKALHQHGPGASDVDGVPPGGGRLAGKTVAGYRRNHEIERVRCISAVCGGIGKRIDNLHLFADRARPSVRDDQRQRILMLRANVNEMNVEPIDLGQELRQGVQFGFDLAPVIICRPIARQCLHRGELYSLRRICNRFSFRPFRRIDAPAQFGQFGFRYVHMERANGCLVSSLFGASLSGGSWCHCVFLL